MTNPRIKAILRAVVEEGNVNRRNEKLFLIEDIIKVKKTLYGFGHTQHDEFLKDETATALFDELYELDVIALELILKEYSFIATQTANKRINV